MKFSFDLVIGVVGLGYVGLAVAIEFGKKYKTYGFRTECIRGAWYRCRAQ